MSDRSPIETSPIETSVVIPSYRRPDDLARTIASILAQEGVGGRFEIVVVDNDPAETARTTAETMAGETQIPIRYVAEPRPGISHARNSGVAAARGRYLAFIDDDEQADPQWLARFLAAMRDFSADAVVGPVYPRFPASADEIDPYTRRVYTRDACVPTGTPLPRWRIGNSIFRREHCFIGAEPFDPRLGLSGGEDTVFLRQMTRRGCKMVWCGEAMVWETVPADRLDPKYLLRRAFRGAQTSTFVCTAVKPRELGRALRLMTVGCAQIVLYGPAGLALKMLNHRGWLPVMAKAAGGLGKLFWHPGLHLQLYR